MRRTLPVLIPIPTRALPFLLVAAFARAEMGEPVREISAVPSAPSAGTSDNSPADPAADGPAVAADSAAAKFSVSCAGCHSLTGAQLSGPALNAAKAWPDDQLAAAIKKMEPRTGPLPDDVVAGLVAFVKSADATDRLAKEQARIAAQFAAKLEPADPALGEALFRGSRALANGGLACAGCHAVNGDGGNLGPDLAGIHAKSGGDIPLISSIEGSKFKIMEPHYARHPVTKQEAAHLAKYLSAVSPGEPAAAAGMPRFAVAGAGLGGALLVGMFALLQHQRSTRRRDDRPQRRRK